MAGELELERLLAPIAGPNPAGENLRYTPVYDQIQEARRAEDEFDRGDWDRPVKKSDWAQVVTLCAGALATASKDLQIAVWLLEGLIQTRQFAGLRLGLEVLGGLLDHYWDQLYPQIEDDDLDFRASPLEYVNQKLGPTLKQIALTDPRQSSGYSWYQWKESRQVGAESDLLNRYGDVDESKKKQRDQLLAEGKLAAEAFDSAVAFSNKAFYRDLATELNDCHDLLTRLSAGVDARFGREAPSLEQFRRELEDCRQLVGNLLAEKLKSDPDPVEEAAMPNRVAASDPEPERAPMAAAPAGAAAAKPLSAGSGNLAAAPLPASVPRPESDQAEQEIWQQALALLRAGSFREALALLLAASFSAPSVRARTRCRLLMARLCLEAERPDLARPIAEQLYTLTEELQLSKWESPTWIAEMLDVLYRCLTSGDPGDDDLQRARGLFERICTTDVTRAMPYRP